MMTPEERAEHVLGKIANDLKWTMPPPLYREWIADAIRATMLEAAEAGTEVERLRADRLKWAEAGAKAMRADILKRANGAWTLKFSAADYHSQMDVDSRPIVEMLASADPAAVARRAVSEGGG